MNWKLLYKLYRDGKAIPGISLEYLPCYDTVMCPCYRVQETGDFNFDMLRLINGRKITYHNDLGIIGWNALHLNHNHCYLTEGVSDMMSTWFYMRTEGCTKLKKSNVLGLTNLSGNHVAKSLLISLFDNYTIITDSDATGVKNAGNLRRFLLSYNKGVRVILPETGCKDISDEYVQFCRINGIF